MIAPLIWIIGVLFTAGFYFAKDIDDRPSDTMSMIMLILFLWPYILGFEVYLSIVRKD